MEGLGRGRKKNFGGLSYFILSWAMGGGGGARYY